MNSPYAKAEVDFGPDRIGIDDVYIIRRVCVQRHEITAKFYAKDTRILHLDDVTVLKTSLIFKSEIIRKAADDLKIFLTVEMSLGQMLEDVQLAVAGKAPVVFYGRPGGGVPTVDEILNKIRELTIPKKRKA